MMNALLLAVVVAGAPASVFDVPVTTSQGAKTTLAAHRGKVLVIVNTASRCEYTPQYKALEALYREYQSRGLVVLGFPSNDFGAQEPGTDEQIRRFCRRTYQVTFPLFAKAPVSGPRAQPLYRFLSGQVEHGGEVTWNFNKFIIAPDGRVAAHLPSGVDPASEEFRRLVESLLPGADAGAP